MNIRNGSEKFLGDGEDRRLTDARRANKANVLIRIKISALGADPNLLLKRPGNDTDGGPLAEDRRGGEDTGVLNE